jgi:chromosome segregation ATPase
LYFEKNDEYETEKSKLEAATNAATDKAYDRAKAELTKAAAALTLAKGSAAAAKTAKEAAEKAVTANEAEVERITKNFNALTNQSGTEATRLRNELSNANSALNRSYTDSRTNTSAYQVVGQAEVDA